MARATHVAGGGGQYGLRQRGILSRLRQVDRGTQRCAHSLPKT